MHKISEGLRAGDLEGTVEKRFTVDRFKSKMGDDKDVMVLAFSVTSPDAAMDLEKFAEKGYPKILDADATPGTMDDGKHRVFVEISREPSVHKQIEEFLDDLKKLTNIENFEFTYHKRTTPFLASTKNLSEVLPRTPIAYNQKIHALKLGEIHSFFDKFNLMEFKLNDNIISVKKNKDPNDLKFELHTFGNTQNVLKEIKAFRVDESSMSECMYFTKYFGPYHITKTNEDKFVFTKDGSSAVVSKHKW